MAKTITVDAVDQTGVIPRKDVEWAENAYLGEVGEGKFVIHDDAGTIAIPGHKAISVEQSTSTPARIATGFTRRKGIRRGETYTTGAGREIQVGTTDLNDLLRRKVIRRAVGMTVAEGGTRPAETIAVRLTWLLALPTVAALFADFGAVTYPTITMDAAPYSGQFPGDVLAAMAKAVRFNYYLRYKSGETLAELVFRDDNASTDDTCTLSISNVTADINSTTIFATQPAETELAQDPEHVYSGAYAAHARGAVFEELAATAAAFADRDGVTEDSGTRSADIASRDATTFLHESRDEEQMLPVVLRLRAAKVGLVQAGQRISTRQIHMAPEGWDPARYARILRKRIKQPLNTDNDYDVYLDLSPQEEGPAVCAYPATEDAIYYPLGGPGPLGGGNANPSDGVVHYLRPGIYYPQAPMPGAQSYWHFPQYGAAGGGETTIDYMGDCTQNTLRFIVVGDGTASIQTHVYNGSGRNFNLSSYRPDGTGYIFHGRFASGDLVEVTIDDTSAPDDCVRIIDINAIGGQSPGESCGGKMGWSSMTWVGA